MPFYELVLVRQLYMGCARSSAIGPPSAMMRRVSSPRPPLLMSLGMLPSGRMVGRLYIIPNGEVRGSIPPAPRTEARLAAARDCVAEQEQVLAALGQTIGDLSRQTSPLS